MTSCPGELPPSFWRGGGGDLRRGGAMGLFEPPRVFQDQTTNRQLRRMPGVDQQAALTHAWCGPTGSSDACLVWTNRQP